MSMMNPNYNKFYKRYKKLPGILTIVIAVLVLAWSIVDVIVFSYSPSYRYGPQYGIMDLDSAGLVLVIWWAIGAVLSYATWFFSALTVSATVARTDATIEISNKLTKNN